MLLKFEQGEIRRQKVSRTGAPTGLVVKMPISLLIHAARGTPLFENLEGILLLLIGELMTPNQLRRNIH